MVECPLATAYLFEHQGTPSLCQLCTPLIGNFYYSTLDREPYSIPLHHHCLCSWEILVLEGIFQAKKEELLSDQELNEAELQQNQNETEQCESRLVELERKLEADNLAWAEAKAEATAARQEAERLRQLIELLWEEMDSLEEDDEDARLSLQEEIDALEAMAQEEDDKAELEACLELPVIEELARSAAGPRLQGL